MTAQGVSLGKLQILTVPLSLSSDSSVGGNNTLLTIKSVNVQIVNGNGGTETSNGLGNLIVGYNEKDPQFTQARTGSHNIVVGMGQNFLPYGGFVAGQSNLIEATYATVTGGYENVASSGYASVSGGSGNKASGGSSSVTGGQSNTASADYASVSGGNQNVAFGEWASVSGGEFNRTGGIATSISGGASRNQSTNDGWKAGSDSSNSSASATSARRSSVFACGLCPGGKRRRVHGH